MYTELIFGCSLKTDTPKEVIDTLRYMVGDLSLSKIGKPKFQSKSGQNPLTGGSYYFGVNRSVGRIWYDEISEQWHVSTRSNIKNYQSEIEDFLTWIKPHVESGSGTRDMYAIVTYDEASKPTIYYLYQDYD